VTVAGEIKKDELREMLTAEQVLAQIPISRTTLFRLERDGVFPQGQAITPHRKLWFKDEVVSWQRDLQDPDSALSQAVLLRAAKAPRKPK
jgi:prophage regulatory protein